MRNNDKQLARPFGLYANTKDNIEALTGLTGGEEAYATDTGKVGYYDGVLLVWVWDDRTKGANLFHYKADTTIQTGSPTSGSLIWNDTAQADATVVHLSHLTEDGDDIDNMLAMFSVGDTVLVQDRDNSDNFQFWEISSAPTLHTHDYLEMPVTLTSSGGTGTTNFPNNHRLIVVRYGAGGGAGGGHTIQDEGTPMIARSNLNFVGMKVTVTDDSVNDATVVTIEGSNFFIDQSGGTSDTYGVLAGAVNGSNTVFTVSQAKYNSGSLKVYLNGQLLTQGSGEDWVETSPGSGTFTFATAPASGDLITVEYAVAPVSSADADTVDGFHASAFALASHNHDAGDINSGSLAIARLGNVVFLYPFSSYTTVGSGISASPAFPYSCTLPTFTTYPVKWCQGIFLGATNDASNYWTLELYDGGTATLLGSVSTQSLTPGIFHLLTDTTLALSSLTQATHKYLYIRAVKTGAPSNLSAHGPAVEYTLV